MRLQTESCAVEKVPVTVANVSAHPKTGGCLESTVSVTTESVTNMTASSAQGMGCAIAATVSAGTAGQGTLAKSGWEQSTEEERTMVLETGGLAAPSDESATSGHHQAGKTPPTGKPREEDETKGCNSAYRSQHSFFYCTGYK